MALRLAAHVELVTAAGLDPMFLSSRAVLPPLAHAVGNITPKRAALALKFYQTIATTNQVCNVSPRLMIAAFEWKEAQMTALQIAAQPPAGLQAQMAGVLAQMAGVQAQMANMQVALAAQAGMPAALAALAGVPAALAGVQAAQAGVQAAQANMEDSLRRVRNMIAFSTPPHVPAAPLLPVNNGAGALPPAALYFPPTVAHFFAFRTGQQVLASFQVEYARAVALMQHYGVPDPATALPFPALPAPLAAVGALARLEQVYGALRVTLC